VKAAMAEMLWVARRAQSAFVDEGEEEGSGPESGGKRGFWRISMRRRLILWELLQWIIKFACLLEVRGLTIKMASLRRI